jgi:glyoxylase-like metal-dependent hydrolase (beta-lactamase superfamily II)
VIPGNTTYARAWLDRTPPPVERVRQGIWSVPVPMPDSPLRYVIAYALELPDGIALVDAGWPSDDAWDALVRGLAQTGHDIAAVRAVLVTHMHADHHGLAERVRRESGAWIGMHRLDAEVLRRHGTDPEALVTRVQAWMIARGAPPGDAAEMAGEPADQVKFLAMAQPDRYIDDGDEVLGPADFPDRGRARPWRLRAVWTPGHTPGHLCFADRDGRFLLSGDHVLPRISPNISHGPESGEDPLGDYLGSHARSSELHADEVLPAHEWRFTGLRERCTALTGHHDDRLGEVYAAVRDAPGSSTFAVARAVTWSRPWDQTRFFMRRAAVGETLAHLTLLANRGALRNASRDVDEWYAL